MKINLKKSSWKETPHECLLYVIKNEGDWEQKRTRFFEEKGFSLGEFENKYAEGHNVVDIIAKG